MNTSVIRPCVRAEFWTVHETKPSETLELLANHLKRLVHRGNDLDGVTIDSANKKAIIKEKGKCFCMQSKLVEKNEWSVVEKTISARSLSSS